MPRKEPHKKKSRDFDEQRQMPLAEATRQPARIHCKIVRASIGFRV
jgi:hypothetical protein